MFTKEKTLKYLCMAGVDNNVAQFIIDNELSTVIKILGNDLDSENNFIRKLKVGSDSFKIFDNGSVWIFCEKNPKTEKKSVFRSGKYNLGPSANDKYDLIKTSKLIKYENEIIYEKIVNEKIYKRNDEITYDGDIEELSYDRSSKKLVGAKQSSWFGELHSGIPNKKLNTTIKTLRSGFMDISENKEINYNTPDWNLVLNGKVKSQDIIENQNNKKLSTLKKFKLMKNNIFARIMSKDLSSLFKKLRLESLELLKNEELEKIVHCEFTMEAKKCIWTLEQVTENSRDIIMQMCFENTEKFRREMLEPFIVDYAQSNLIMQGRVNKVRSENFQYRAFSTTNNVITINNVSMEYANYISKEVKKIEPVIYNAQMEQNEKNKQSENVNEYQKINKKRNGFLNILFLAFIIGFMSGFILFIMCIILKYNIGL